MTGAYIGLRMFARYPSGAWVHVDHAHCGVHVRALAVSLCWPHIRERRA